MGDEAVDPEEPTGLAGAVDETESVRAWGLDDDVEDYDEWEPARGWFTSGRITAGAVAVSVLLAAAAGVVGWEKLRRDEPGPVMVTAAPPVMAPTVTSVAPPVTVTITPEAAPTKAPAPTPVAIPAPPVSEADQQLIVKLMGQGWQVSDPALVQRRAHQACAMLHSGSSPDDVASSMATATDSAVATTRAVIIAAMTVYPDCP